MSTNRRAWHMLSRAEAATALEANPDADLSLGDRSNTLYMNTVLTRGRAEMLVTATGMDTEMGRLAGMMAATPESQTPLQRQLDSLGKRLAAIAGVVVVLFLIRILGGADLAEAAIPEGLPAVVTVTLAIGMWRMAQNRAILKRLSAVETLGSTTVICSDKTGTLTLNQMTARAGWYRGRPFSGAEHRSAFNRNFFRNGKLWLALLGVVLLQAVVVHWPAAQEIFNTTDLSASDWLLAAVVASSVLVFDEIRKMVWRQFGWQW
jgi:magnesium-transporting ATPase (P-type)